jgi:hypothetical protein
MKVFMYYEDNEDKELHKTLKITLPKSWKTGPTSRLLTQFVESYNASFPNNTLDDEVHLATEEGDDLVHLPSDAITQDVIPDRANVYVRHGPSISLADVKAEEAAALKEAKDLRAKTVACTHFGCKNRFPKGGPYPDCCHHASPPVFHETAKFWSCCPTKKAYDWGDFEAIKGCVTGTCTDVKEDGQKQFLGGMELREQNTDGDKLRSIDDFNTVQRVGNAAPVLERFQKVLKELGVEQELYDQVFEGMKKELEGTISDESELLEAVVVEFGAKLKATMKAIAVDQLRIK